MESSYCYLLKTDNGSKTDSSGKTSVESLDQSEYADNDGSPNTVSSEASSKSEKI